MGGRGAKSRLKREKRGQYPSYKNDDVAFEMFKKETGYSDKDAREPFALIHEYLLGNYDFNNYSYFDLWDVDDALHRMGAYDGTIYRGVGLSAETIKSLKIGDYVEVAPTDNFLSSWSSEESAARNFGFGSSRVIFVCKNNKSGVGVQHISPFGDGEAEVLVPSTAKYKVVSKKPAGGKYTYIEVEEV